MFIIVNKNSHHLKEHSVIRTVRQTKQFFTSQATDMSTFLFVSDSYRLWKFPQSLFVSSSIFFFVWLIVLRILDVSNKNTFL